MIFHDKNKCPLCGNAGEIFSHLFLHCNFVSGLWHQLAGLWDISLVCTGSFNSFSEMWLYMDLPAQDILP